VAAVTGNYARALAEVVMERKLDAARALEDMESLAQLVESSPQLRVVWENPSVPARQKLALLDAIAKHSKVSREARNFLAVLVDHRRLAALPEIARQFKAEVNQRLGIAEAEITTARELGEHNQRALEAQVGRMTGKKVRAHYARDAKILGGAVVRLGSTIYDGSVRGQLQRLKRAIAEG